MDLNNFFAYFHSKKYICSNGKSKLCCQVKSYHQDCPCPNHISKAKAVAPHKITQLVF